MAYTYLITETELKQDTIMQNNVDSKLIGMAMREAQDIYTRDVLGSALYNQLIIEFNAETLTAANQTLLDYVKPMQRYYILKEFLMYGWIKLANSSVGTRDVDDLQTSQQDGINAIEGRFEQKAEYYKKRLINMICDNITDYPLYNTGNQEIYPNQKAYTSSFRIFNKNGEEKIQYQKANCLRKNPEGSIK